jgi:hypothetical protein
LSASVRQNCAELGVSTRAPPEAASSLCGEEITFVTAHRDRGMCQADYYKN